MRLSSLIARAFFSSIAAVVLIACGSSAPPPRVVAKPAETPKKQADPPKVAVCNDVVDVSDLFTRHAAAYGSEAAVAQALPITIAGTVTVSGKPGTFEASVDAKHVRNTIHVKGFERANGTDDTGAWQLGNSGAVSRLNGGEASPTDEWIFRRHYLSSFDPKRDLAVCHVDNGKREIIVHEKIDAVGSPRFVFDQDSAELIGAEFTGIDGRSSTRTFTWDANATTLPKWPTQSSEQDGDGSTIEKTRETLVTATADAFALPPSTIDIAWPKSGSVRVPMKLYGGEIFLDVTVGGKKARALLDSGAGISIVDASGTAADAFTTELEFGGDPAAAQRAHFGIGKLSELKVGALVVKNIPAARVPIPAVDTFGPNRPDVVLGWSLFEGNAVRIDYARNELVFSRDSSSLHAAGAQSMDILVWDDRIVQVTRLGAHKTPVLQLDTGSAFTISLYRGWAKKNQLPGPDTQAVSMLGISGGPDPSPLIYFRSAFSLGPISAQSDFIEVGESRDDGHVAGLMGNLAFAKCAAVTFDVPNRKMYFDAPCDRKPAQSHAWWTLAKSDDATNADHPWVVVSTAAAGTADAAGVAPRDRIVAIDGRPVGLAFDFIATFTKPLGTNVALTVMRGTETKKLSMKLSDPF